MPTGKIADAESAWHSSLQEFGAILRDRRIRVLGRSQDEMAARVGLDQSRISRIETGGRPRDKATARIIADGYDLTTAQRKAWFDLLFGDSLFFVAGEVPPESKGFVERVYDLMEVIRFAGENGVATDFFEHFATALFCPASAQPAVDEHDLDLAIEWLLAKPRRLYRSHLLVDLAPTVMHYLNVRGRHRQRLALALAAADAAQETERRTVEGWLRSDSIAWTLMEHKLDPTVARLHLERGLALAKELKNRDMEALALAFLARSYIITADTRQTSACLTRALSISCSPAIRARIEWIAGDFVARQKSDDRAILQYRSAEALDLDLNSGHHAAVTPLFRLGDLYLRVRDTIAAKDAFSTALVDVQPQLVGERRAFALFGLARVARTEKDLGTAHQLARDALAALATADGKPHFQQIIIHFLASTRE